MINWRKPLIYFLFYLSGSYVPRDLRILRDLEKKDNNYLKKIQENRLKAVLLHAWKNVPYYKNILEEAEVVVDGAIKLENFKSIPFLTKDIIRKEKSNLYSIDHESRRSFKNTSGGSTGEPLLFMQDKEYWDMNGIAAKIYYFERLGKELGEPEVDVWGSERDIFRNSLSLKERLINFLYNRTILNAFKFNDEKLDHFVEKINKIKPVAMWVYIESIEALAKHIKNNDLKIHSPKFIISTAGTLLPEARKLIQDVFHCPVYNQYGSREAGTLAIECEKQDGLHTFPFMHYLEVIDEEIVITSLTNFSMPLIRYKIGDTAIKAKEDVCSCGKGFRLFGEITGRTASHFKTVKGNTVHSMVLIRQFWFQDWLKKFQLVQRRTDLIDCYVVKCSEVEEDRLRLLEDRIRFIMDGDCKVDFKFVEEIEPSPSGKNIFTICKI